MRPPELSYYQLWALAFVLTQTVETPLYTWALGRLGTRPRWLGGVSAGRGPLPLVARVGLGFLASLLTHPVVWFVWPLLISPVDHYPQFVFAAECFAVLTEAALLWLGGLRWALPISLAVNMASVGVGLLSRALFGLP